MKTKRFYSLTQAAEFIGVGRRTVKRWLAQDLGIILPRVRHGAKVLIRQEDLDLLIEKRRDARAA